jgi:hypothetical protein
MHPTHFRGSNFRLRSLAFTFFIHSHTSLQASLLLLYPPYLLPLSSLSAFDSAPTLSLHDLTSRAIRNGMSIPTTRINHLFVQMDMVFNPISPCIPGITLSHLWSPFPFPSNHRATSSYLLIIPSPRHTLALVSSLSVTSLYISLCASHNSLKNTSVL